MIISQNSLLLKTVRPIFHSTLQLHILYAKFDLLIGKIKFFIYILKSHRSTLSYLISPVHDRLCGLVVRVPGYRSRGPGFDSQRYQIF
jgi:hypothetical protein